MSKQSNSLKGRVRDKVKQVILIEGIPKVLYRIRESKVVVIKFNNKSYRLDIPTELMNELKKLQTIEVSESTRKSKSFKPIVIPGLGHRTTVRAVNGNTHITIGGADENQLSERIQIIREHLTSLGIDNTERCHWVCSTDKAKPNTDYSYPHRVDRTWNESADNTTLNTEAKVIVSESTRSSKESADNTTLNIEAKVNKKKEMSSHTKSLHDIAVKTMKEAKA